MKQFKVTVVYEDGSINCRTIKEIYTAEAQSEMSIYRNVLFEYGTDLCYVYVEDVAYDVDDSWEDKFFVIDKAVVYTLFADTDCPYRYMGREICIVDDIEALLATFEDVAVAHFVRRANPDEYMQWVDSMRAFALN